MESVTSARISGVKLPTYFMLTTEPFSIEITVNDFLRLVSPNWCIIHSTYPTRNHWLHSKTETDLNHIIIIVVAASVPVIYRGSSTHANSANRRIN